MLFNTTKYNYLCDTDNSKLGYQMKNDYFTKFKRTDKQINDLLEYEINKKYHNHSQFEIHDIEEAVKLDPDLSIESHIHDFYLIVWFEKGVGKHIIDFK